MDGTLLLQAGMEENDEHTQVIAVFGSLIGKIWKSERRVKFLYGPSVRVRSTNTVVRLERSAAQVLEEN